jgi:hypothetical protein
VSTTAKAVRRTKKAAQKIWKSICEHAGSMPAKNLVPPFTEHQISVMHRLNAIIARLEDEDAPELYRVLCHADVVVVASRIKAVTDEVSNQVSVLTESGTLLLSDEECMGAGLAGSYSTVLQHVKWLKETTPDLEEKRVAEQMYGRLFVSLSNVSSFAGWLRAVENMANKTESQLWANVANAGIQLSRALQEAGRHQEQDAQSRIYPH